jgi:hypothetical protein
MKCIYIFFQSKSGSPDEKLLYLQYVFLLLLFSSMRKKKEYNETVHQLCMDFKEAYK